MILIEMPSKDNSIIIVLIVFAVIERKAHPSLIASPDELSHTSATEMCGSWVSPLPPYLPRPASLRARFHVNHGASSRLMQVSKLEQEVQRQKQVPSLQSQSHLERRAIRGGGGNHHAQEVTRVCVRVCVCVFVCVYHGGV